jgi:hypothetical protein
MKKRPDEGPGPICSVIRKINRLFSYLIVIYNYYQETVTIVIIISQKKREVRNRNANVGQQQVFRGVRGLLTGLLTFAVGAGAYMYMHVQ